MLGIRVYQTEEPPPPLRHFDDAVPAEADLVDLLRQQLSTTWLTPRAELQGA